MEKHVVSLELAKQLKEAGVPQKSEFYWFKDGCEAHSDREPTYYVKSEEYNPNDIKICSAFLASEIGEMLPSIINGKIHLGYHFWMNKQSEYWRCGYEQVDGVHALCSNESLNMADCMAGVLLDLLKQGLLKINENK